MKLSKHQLVKIADEQLPDTSVELLGADIDESNPILEDEQDMDHEEAIKSNDPRQSAATPHAHAAKDLFAKRRELLAQVADMDKELGNHREVLRALDPKMRHEAYADDKELRNYLKPEKKEDPKKKKKLDRKAELEVIGGLLKIADVLDAAGDDSGIDMIENILQVFAAKDDGIPHYDVSALEKVKRDYPEINVPAPFMSMRGCPDHRGSQMKRVADNSYQCELDGKIYNWNAGFKDYEGNVYPGAKIQSVDFPEMSTKMFENREQALSKNQK